MIFYNVTISVEIAVKKDFLEWFLHEHTLEMLATGLFFDVNIEKRLLPESEGFETFTFQYICKNFENYERYIGEHSEAMRNKFPDKLKGRFQTTRTITEPIKTTQQSKNWTDEK